VCAACLVAVAVAFRALSLPSPVLLAGLLVGGCFGWRAGDAVRPPRPARHAAQAVVGAIAAVGVSPESLGMLLDSWAPVLLVSGATLSISVAMGVALGRLTRLDLATSTLGMIAGGASGVVSMARELGADDGIVAIMQYLRVTLAVALTPLVAAQVFHAAAPAAAGHASAADGGWLSATLFVAGCAAAGLLLARRLRIPGAHLLWPMLLAVALSLTTSWHAAAVPSALADAAFAVIGLQVGVRLTPAVLRRIGAVLPVTVMMILTMMALSALLGVALAALTPVSLTDGYLATTPGGLPAVVAVAVETKANSAFILTVQVLRTVLMLMTAAPLARWAHTRAARGVACQAH
jgi:uncharacterized protein